MAFIYFVVGTVLFVFSLDVPLSLRFRYYIIPLNMGVFFLVSMNVTPGTHHDKLHLIAILTFGVGALTRKIVFSKADDEEEEGSTANR